MAYRDKAKEDPSKEPTIAESETAEVDRKPVDKKQVPSSQVRRVRPGKESNTIHKYNILLVDDEPGILDALERTFMDEYNVFSATDAEKALSIMEERDIALIIADYRMPGMMGTELLEKAMQRYPYTIRLLLSGYIDQEMLMDAINTVQIHGVIAKPYGVNEIRFTVKTWIQQYEKFRNVEDRSKQNELRQTQEAESANQQVTELTRQLEQIKRLLEYYQQPWYKKLFRKNPNKGE